VTGAWEAGPSMRRVGRRILDARTAAGVTQQQLADVIGLGRSSVANMEGGRQSVDAVQLAQIARALRVGLGDLVRAEDLPPEPVAPHVVEIRTVYEVTCRTCGPGQPLDAARSREQAAQSRKDHIAEMLARENGEAP
jgi:transcriptional regulator with XRE-family HTH domain